MIAKLSAPKGKQSLSNFLRKAVGLSPVATGLLQEAAKASGVSLSTMPPADLAGLINAVPIELTGIAPIARAISTAGGISFDELDADYMICEHCPACSQPARCWIGKRRPAATCCRRRLRRERRPGGAC